MRLFTAFRAFFAALSSGETALRLAAALNPREVSQEEPQLLPPPAASPSSPSSATEEKSKTASNRPSKSRTEVAQHGAITLLSALQREARFVDFVQESLTDYSDAQIGAAARSVHDSCAKVLERFFALEPICTQPEESLVAVDERNYSSFQIAGGAGQKPPFSGKLTHPGWKATKLELPQWVGNSDNIYTVAPAEVEV